MAYWYWLSKSILILIRKFIQGEAAVKREGVKFLPHPNQLECNTPEQIGRYEAYKMGAEVEDFPSRTLNDLLGAMNRHHAKVNLPEKLQYQYIRIYKYKTISIQDKGYNLSMCQLI